MHSKIEIFRPAAEPTGVHSMGMMLEVEKMVTMDERQRRRTTLRLQSSAQWYFFFIIIIFFFNSSNYGTLSLSWSRPPRQQETDNGDAGDPSSRLG